MATPRPHPEDTGTGNPDVLSSLINEEFLTCKICFDSLSRPKILDCLHSFCQQCLSDHIEQNELLDLLPCPLCRQRTPIPNGVSDLKDNFMLMSLQDAVVLTKPPDETEPVDVRGGMCDSCKSRGEERLFRMMCLDCQENLCEECIQAHQRLNLTKHHTMVQGPDNSPSEPPARSLLEKPDTRPVTCPEHADEEAKLYCETCHVIICYTCRLTTHEGHRCLDFDEASTREKRSLFRWLGFIQSRIEKYEGILADWKRYRTDLERQKCGIQAQIDHRCQELHTLVDGWHYATSKQLEAVHKEEEKHLHSKLDMVEMSLGTNKGLLQLTDTILQHTSPVNFLTLRNQLIDDLGRLQRENLNALCHTQSSVFTFTDTHSVNFDYMGTFIVSQEKVLGGMQISPVQNLTFVGEFSTRQQPSGSRFDASSIYVNSKDHVIVTDRQTDRITMTTLAGERISELNVFLMGKPIYTVSTATGDVIFTRDKQSICIFNANNKHRRNIKEHFSKPGSLALSHDDKMIHVLDYDTKIVTKICAETYSKISHVKLHYKKSSLWDKVCVNSQGNLYISSFEENCVYEFTATGQKLAQYGRWGSTDAGELYWPRGMCCDAHDNIIIADTNNSRLQLLTPQGAWVLLDMPEGHKVGSPTDVAITRQGQLCVLDKCGHVHIYQYLPY